MADPLQGRLAIFGQFDEHTVGLPLLQGTEESLGGAGTVVANAEDFVHWSVGLGGEDTENGYRLKMLNFKKLKLFVGKY